MLETSQSMRLSGLYLKGQSCVPYWVGYLRIALLVYGELSTVFPLPSRGMILDAKKRYPCGFCP